MGHISQNLAIYQDGHTDGSEPRVGLRRQPTSDAAIIERGQAAQRHLHKFGPGSWAKWSELSLAVLVVQQQAMNAASVAEPRGKKYQDQINHRLRLYGFDTIHKSTRSILVEVAKNLDAINAWRTDLAVDENGPDHKKLLELYHPRAVLACWKRSTGSKGRGNGKDLCANPLLAVWERLSRKQRADDLAEIPFPEFRLSLPDAWVGDMKAAVAGLVSTDRDPDRRITTAVQAALEHIVAADGTKTGTATKLSQEKAALDELREALRALQSVKRDITELDVGLVRPWAGRVVH